MDQRRLVERAGRGDHDAFAELARAAVVRLDQAARLILRDPELARDAVQEGLIRAWRDLPKLRDPDRFDAWLHRLTVNACIDLARRRRRRPIEVELTSIHAPAVTDTTRALADRDVVDGVLRHLDERERAIVVLHYFLGMPLTDPGHPGRNGQVAAPSRPWRDADRDRGRVRHAPRIAGSRRASRMTTDRHLERDLPTILGEIAMGTYPDYIDDVLATTAQRRQRPGWTFPERWLPVELVKSRAPVTRLPVRLIGVVAIVVVLLAAMLVAYIGSQPQRLPPPFGVAANGLVTYVQGGDIYMADPVTGLERAAVTGPETDLRPIWSRDGTRVVFERKVAGDNRLGWLFVANQDGRGLVRVTPEPLSGLVDYAFSPDGRSIVSFARGERGLGFMVIASDGTGQPTFFYVGATSEDGAVQYRPDGSEIMFIGRKPGADYRDLNALDPASGKVRSIVEGSVSGDIHAASWSPDGTHIAYAKFDQNALNRSTRTHVVNADGSGDVAVDISPDSIADGGSNWSNDGTRLVITRFYPGGPDDLARTAIVPIDRSSVGVEIECAPGATPQDCSADWIWSPDDSVLLGGRSDASDQPLPQIMADPLTGKVRATPWTATGYPDWQRVAR